MKKTFSALVLLSAIALNAHAVELKDILGDYKGEITPGSGIDCTVSLKQKGNNIAMTISGGDQGGPFTIVRPLADVLNALNSKGKRYTKLESKSLRASVSLQQNFDLGVYNGKVQFAFLTSEEISSPCFGFGCTNPSQSKNLMCFIN